MQRPYRCRGIGTPSNAMFLGSLQEVMLMRDFDSYQSADSWSCKMVETYWCPSSVTSMVTLWFLKSYKAAAKSLPQQELLRNSSVSAESD